MIDFDPSAQLFYLPVDLNAPLLLAQNGLPPSEADPQFHQQMVFAVAMWTIKTFERALGRKVMWACDSPGFEDAFVPRLRIYPHALRRANAYYSAEKTALLFGYFDIPAGDTEDGREWVFTCLSADIVAHETAHAILHGMQRRSVNQSSSDSLSFHEAFADIVAMLQHFAMKDVVKQQMAAAKGSLRGETLLTGLAQQYGEATGRRGALRFALDRVVPAAGGGAPNPGLRDTVEPHERGSFLVGAVFDAFASIYERRTGPLRRLVGATEGGTLPTDLVEILAAQASKCAAHLLRACVRALDHLPPVDVRFGDFLRALITADRAAMPADPHDYRAAFAESFRRCGIRPQACLSMSPDGLDWGGPVFSPEGSLSEESARADVLRKLLPRLQLGMDFASRPPDGGAADEVNLRDESHRLIELNKAAVAEWLMEMSWRDNGWEAVLGLRMRSNAPITIERLPGGEAPLVRVDTVRIARRTEPSASDIHYTIIQLTQRRRAYFDPAVTVAAEDGTLRNQNHTAWDSPDFWFWGGATLHIDLRDGRLTHVIAKRIDDASRLDRERAYRLSLRRPVAMHVADEHEPLAILHLAQPARTPGAEVLAAGPGTGGPTGLRPSPLVAGPNRFTAERVSAVRQLSDESGHWQETANWLHRHYFLDTSGCRYGLAPPKGHVCRDDLRCELPQAHRRLP